MAMMSQRIVRRQAVILPARAIRCEIEAISASFGFDPFCPLLRWQAWTWNHQALRLPPCTEQNGLKPRRDI
jgi:hypothetical protein